MAEEVDFFRKGKREIEIGNDYKILKSPGKERRVKGHVRIPLSNRPMTNIPEWIASAYAFVVKDDAPYTKIVCKDTRLEGISIDFFTTEQTVQKSQTSGGASLAEFSVERTGKGEKAIVYVNFTIYAPTSKANASWWYDAQGNTFFAAFDTTQATMTYGGEDDEDESDGDDTQGILAGMKAEKAKPEKPSDPNDDPKKPIPFDKRKVTLPHDKPGDPKKRSHHKKKPTA